MLNHTDAIWRFSETRRRDMLPPTACKPFRQPEFLLAAITDHRYADTKPLRQPPAQPSRVRRAWAHAFGSTPQA